VYVNPVTTMVTGVLLRRPEFSLQQAQARVRRFLAMPANASLGAALRETQRFHSAYFSESAFLIQANAHGGELYFEEDLVNQMLHYIPTGRLVISRVDKLRARRRIRQSATVGCKPDVSGWAA
jgi:hypothetical protein